MEHGLRTIEYEETAGVGESAAPPTTARVMVMPELASADARRVRLTPNEVHMLEWLAAGRTNAQIAQCVGRSAKTIGNQLTSVYAKLGAVNRAEAVAIYLRRGLT